jgi:hypothetical protein
VRGFLRVLFSNACRNFCSGETARHEFFGAPFGVRWQSAAATPLWEKSSRCCEFESGVALCFPPHSKARFQKFTIFVSFNALSKNCIAMAEQQIIQRSFK